MGEHLERTQVKNKQKRFFRWGDDEIIITTKEARKLLGKETSEKLNDTDLVGIIRNMVNLANSLLAFEDGSKNKKGMVR